MYLTKTAFWLALFLIAYSYIGYYLFLNIVYFFYWLKGKNVTLQPPSEHKYPKVSFIISAYNEEKVIEKKLANTLQLDYPKEKLEIIVASDHSNDRTHEIVRQFKSDGVRLFVATKRRGKTNVQNEVVRIATGEILVFSDANAMWDQNAIIRLVAAFNDPKIGYVAGRLEYINSDSNVTSYSESLYWKYDLLLRTFESQIYSITAGNGAIYAVRKEDYEFVDPMYTHDLEFPHLMVEKGKRAIYDDNALAFEKAGETLNDEFKRKVRMFGRNWQRMLTNLNMFNPLKVGLLYSIFMISHKLLRYFLPFLHIALMIANIMLISQRHYLVLLIFHILFYVFALIGFVTRTHSKLFYIPLYYVTFQYTELLGFIRFITGGNKAYWEKAESTRE